MMLHDVALEMSLRPAAGTPAISLWLCTSAGLLLVCARGPTMPTEIELYIQTDRNIMSRDIHASVTADRMYLTGRPPILLGKRCRSSAAGSASSTKPSSHCADAQHQSAVQRLIMLDKTMILH